MGIASAALASVIAEISTALLVMIITLVKVDLKKYNLFRFPKLKLSIIEGIMDVAGFIMILFFVSILSWFSFFTIIEKKGERNLDYYFTITSKSTTKTIWSTEYI